MIAVIRTVLASHDTMGTTIKAGEVVEAEGLSFNRVTLMNASSKLTCS